MLFQVIKLVWLILVNPATNTVCEWLFTATRRIKTYLCSTMGQGRLNAVMILHVHNRRRLTKSLLWILQMNLSRVVAATTVNSVWKVLFWFTEAHAVVAVYCCVHRQWCVRFCSYLTAINFSSRFIFTGCMMIMHSFCYAVVFGGHTTENSGAMPLSVCYALYMLIHVRNIRSLWVIRHSDTQMRICTDFASRHAVIIAGSVTHNRARAQQWNSTLLHSSVCKHILADYSIMKLALIQKVC